MNTSLAEPMSREAAQDVAVRGLLFLAGNDDLLSRFSALSGIAPGDMRAAAADPGFLVGVLDFFLAHEPDLVALSEAENMAPEDAVRARFTLEPEDVSGFE